MKIRTNLSIKISVVKFFTLVFLAFLTAIPFVQASKDIKIWTYKEWIYPGKINLVYVENIGTEDVSIIWVFVQSPSGGHWYKEQNFVLTKGERKICSYPHDFSGASTEKTGAYEVEVWWEGGTKTTVFYVANATAVGGVIISVDRFSLLVPYFGVASTIIVTTVATVIYVKRVKHRKEKQ